MISGATDEGSIAWVMRIARALPLVPACGAAVTVLALARASRRGELLALEAIGCSPARAALFVVIAASALSIAAAASVAGARGVALDAFFPRAPSRADVRVDHDDGFRDDARGVRIARDGAMTRVAAADVALSAPRASGPRTASAALVLVAFGIAFPLVAARATKRVEGKPLIAAAAMCALCILLLQAAAADRAPAVLAIFPAVALLVFAIVRYRSLAW